MSFFLAANFLDWSYQSAKACSVLVGENTEVLYPKTAAEIAQSQNRTSVNRQQRPQSISPGGREHSDVTSRYDVLESSSKSRVRREVSNTHDAVVEALVPSEAQQHEHDPGVLIVTDSDLDSTTENNFDSTSTTTTVDDLPSSANPWHDRDPPPFPRPMRKVSFVIPPEELFLKLPISHTEKKMLPHVPSEPINNRFGAVEFFDDIHLRKEVERTSEIVKKTMDAPPQRKIRHSKKLEEIEGVQHDYPVFSYGEDEYKIIKLQNEGKLKRPDHLENDVKELHGIELHGLKLTQESGKNDGKVSAEHLLMNETLENRNQSETFPTELENPVETHNTTRHSKRVLVNVTIATEDDEKGLKPVYVVSLSVPTEESKSSRENLTNVVLGFDNNGKPNELASLPPPPPPTSSHPLKSQNFALTTPRHGYFYGGQCECSCPCLDSSESNEDTISSTSTKPDQDPFEKTISDVSTSTIPSSEIIEDLTTTESNVISSSTENNSVSSTEYPDDLTGSTSEKLPTSTEIESTTETETSTSEFATSTDSVSGTSEGCPVVTTPTPQPPMILILEGEDAVSCFNSQRIICIFFSPHAFFQ